MKDSSASRPLPLRIDIEPGESLNGFLLRLAEGNGRTHPRQILGKDLTWAYPGYSGGGGLLEAVAPLSGLPVEALRKLCWEVPEVRPADGRFVRLYQGQLLDRPDLRHKRRAACPACMKEKSFHRARWDLLALGDCSQHGTELVTRCQKPDCGRFLDWDRCSIRECACGYPLSEITGSPARDDRLDLAAYLEGRMSGHEVHEPRLLEGLPLYQAIRVMLLLGALRLGRPPWSAGYDELDPARHDVVSLGFGLSARHPGELVELIELLPEFFEEQHWLSYDMLDRYGWMAEHENRELRQLGGVLVRLSQATAEAHPRRRSGRRWRYR